MAAWRLGAAVTPINPSLRPAEVNYQVSDARATVLIVEKTPEFDASVPRSAWQVSTRSSPKKCDLPEPRPPYTPLYLAGARSDSKTPAVGIFRIDNGTTYSMRKQGRCPQWTRKQSDDRDISKSDTTRAATAAPYRRRPVSARNNQCSGSSSW